MAEEVEIKSQRDLIARVEKVSLNNVDRNDRVNIKHIIRKIMTFDDTGRIRAKGVPSPADSRLGRAAACRR